MRTRPVLLALIAVTMLTFSGVFLSIGASQAAALAFGLGLLWLIMEIHREQSLPTAFFVGFVGLAAWGCLQDLPVVLMLFGLSTSLAAWDVSRFRIRVAEAGSGDTPQVLEARHLRALGITAVSGFVVALLPLLLTISMNFVLLAGMLLVTMWVLRRFILYLRHADVRSG